MKTRQTLTVGAERFRVGPWHASKETAYLAVPPDVPRPTSAGLHAAVDRLAAAGYSSVITSALHREEASPFLSAGFQEYDRLVVLAHPLEDLDPPRPRLDEDVRLRRARTKDRPDALVVDDRAFPPFWRLDTAGLVEAETATPGQPIPGRRARRTGRRLRGDRSGRGPGVPAAPRHRPRCGGPWDRQRPRHRFPALERPTARTACAGQHPAGEHPGHRALPAHGVQAHAQ